MIYRTTAAPLTKQCLTTECYPLQAPAIPVNSLSQAAVNPVPGPSQAAVNPVPGPSQAAVNPVPGPSQAAVNPVPGPSQAAVNPVPGPSQAAVNPVPGLSQAAVNPVPGPSQAAVNPVPGPSQAAVNPVPGPSQTAVNPVPGPSQAAVNPVPGPSQTAVNPVPGPSQAAVNPVPGPSPPPEAVWLPFIQQHYPNRLQQTYFLPPLHFNRSFYSVEHFAGEDIAVMQQPGQQQQQQPQPRGKRHRRRRPAKAPAVPQVPGRLFTSYPPGSQPSSHQESDARDDQAQQSTLQCLQILSDNLQQAMVVVSQLFFRKYLDDNTNPIHVAAAARLPSVWTLPEQLTEGECDILIIHRQHGIVVGEIKSVGRGAFFNSQADSQQNRMIVDKVAAAMRQINNQEMVLRHLVSDLSVTVSRILIFPNLSSAQLLKALTNTPAAQVSVQGPYTPQGSTPLLPKLSVTSKVSVPTSYGWVGSRVHFRSSEDVTLLEFTSPVDREYMSRLWKCH